MSEYPEGPRRKKGSDADEDEQPRTRGEARQARVDALRSAKGLKDLALREAAGPNAGTRGAVLLRSAEGLTVFPGLRTNDNGRFADISREAFLRGVSRLASRSPEGVAPDRHDEVHDDALAQHDDAEQ